MNDWPGIRLLQWCREFHKGEIMSEIYLSDNSGNRCSPHPDISDPVLDTGKSVVAGSKDTDGTVTGLTAGKMYAITSLIGSHIFGIATLATATNIIWACGEGHTIQIRLPIGYTTLYYQTPDSSRRFILRELAG